MYSNQTIFDKVIKRIERAYALYSTVQYLQYIHVYFGEGKFRCKKASLLTSKPKISHFILLVLVLFLEKSFVQYYYCFTIAAVFTLSGFLVLYCPCTAYSEHKITQKERRRSSNAPVTEKRDQIFFFKKYTV